MYRLTPKKECCGFTVFQKQFRINSQYNGFYQYHLGTWVNVDPWYLLNHDSFIIFCESAVRDIEARFAEIRSEEEGVTSEIAQLRSRLKNLLNIQS